MRETGGQASRDYHVARARVELDTAYRASCLDAAAAHLRLFGMHVQRARQLSRAEGAASEAELAWLDRCAPFHERCLVA